MMTPLMVPSMLKLLFPFEHYGDYYMSLLEGKSWVLVAPPKYAPGIPSLVSLYRIISETQNPPTGASPLIDPVIPRNQRNKVCESFELYYVWYITLYLS